ncbi:ABC transporter permease subunit [Bacillus sp. FJAT-28004]|uniref:carbohydrate ABC transporter permease n=1 Tax=Bacillus sp. FJAT-28004 TaxID=1679165 RepID=UPI0006B68153
MWGYLFILPQVIGLIVFHIIPLIWAGYISFTDFDGFGRNNFIAFDNYYSLFKDDELWGSLRNTAYYALLTVGIGVTTALLVALALNVMKGKRFYRVFYFMPVITSTISMGVIWVWMLNGELGIINYVLSVIGIEGPSWLIDERWVIPSIALVGIWATLGKDMIIFLAGLQGISKSYYEASEIDGASGFKQFWHVTLPLLSPTTLFVTILALINSIQVFDQPYVMTGGGPGKSSYTLVYLIYNQAFVEFNMGRASAVAMILFAVILIITLIQFVASKRWVHYES